MNFASNQPTPKMNETEKPWALRLFVARDSAPSATAIIQVRRIVAEYLPKNSMCEVIDLFDDPDAAEADQILAIPTLVRTRPKPVRRVIGDLSDIPRVLIYLGFPLEAHSRQP